jgi:carboxyl-terminal processing protease
MDSQEAEEFNRDMSGEVSGIGAEIGVRTDQPTIIRTLEDSPASKSGIMAGDVIVGVNDESMKGSTSDVVASKIRGEAGTTVKVSVLRDKELKEFNIVRAKVNNPSVRWEIRDNVGVIIMNRFDSEAASSTRAAAKEFKSKGVKAVVLDLRDNGGGYLDAARDVASIWLKDKVIVTEKSGGTVTGTERSSGDPILEGVKTVVVVNGGSASASEIVAGALQEYGAATIVGEKTFGKGSVQQIINLADGRILKVTIAKWYTPKGKNITKEGITPDQTVIMTAADTNAGKDPQMDAAVESIN